MAEYRVKVSRGGQIDTVAVTAEDEAKARKLAGQYGRLISLKRKSSLGVIFSSAMSAAQRIIFLRRFATMIKSKVPVSEALRILGTAFGGSVSRVALALQRQVESGRDFTEALTHLPKDFPATTTALIQAGMRGGNIYKALNDAAVFESEMDQIRRGSGKGLVGAVLSFLIGAGTIIGCSEFLGPYVQSSELVKMAPESAIVDLTFAAADWLGYAVMVLMAGAIGLGILRFIVRPLAPQKADQITMKIPVWRDLMMSQQNYAIFYGMALLQASGVNMETTLRLTFESAPRGEIKADLKRALIALKHGRPWGEAMINLHPTDRASLSTSLNQDQVAESMEAIATLHKELYAQRIGQVVPALQMLAALFMSAGGAIMFGMIVLPILQMGSGIM